LDGRGAGVFSGDEKVDNLIHVAAQIIEGGHAAGAFADDAQQLFAERRLPMSTREGNVGGAPFRSSPWQPPQLFL